MNEATSPTLKARRLSQLIKAMIGTTRTKGIVIAVGLLVTLGWFTNGLLALFTLQLEGWKTFISLVFFPALVTSLLIMIRRSSGEVEIDVLPDDNPAPTKALIIMLSPAKKEKQNFDPWDMPIRAIKHHLGRLEHLIIIPSADKGNLTSDNRAINLRVSGTYHQVEEFKQRVADEISEPTFQIRSLGDFFPEYKKGIDIENIGALVKAMNGVISKLKEEHNIPGYDTLIDITSGQKTPAIAGAIVALAEGRRFQYVSTHDKKVLTYDVTYGMASSEIDSK